MLTVPQPKNVFSFFLDLTKIPRGSGNTKAVSDYCVDFATKRGLWYNQDSANNIIIKKPASKGYEACAPVIIQGHLDMVCEKSAESTIDFLKDGLEIETDGEFIFAKGTTLGADDGIAVAFALAVLDADNLNHPPLEVVFTTDEETGMDGAMALDCSLLSAKTLLNIDSEQEGIFTVSCAGGLNVAGDLKVDFKEENKNGYEITICDLKGGHSGVEIDKRRANANIIAARLLSKLCETKNIRISSINGGLKHNAIPSECKMVIACEDDISAVIYDFKKFIKEEYAVTDPDLEIIVSNFKNRIIKVTSFEETKNIASLLSKMPDGVYSMSNDIDGLVKTSSNLGILETNDRGLFMLSSVRSSDENEKDCYSDIVLNHMLFHNAAAKKGEDYPAWEFLQNSPLRTIMCKVFEEMYQKPPVTEAIHAGLECGIFCGKIKGLDCVSFGPDILDIHTPKERLNIESAKRTWEFLIKVLENLKA